MPTNREMTNQQKVMKIYPEAQVWPPSPYYSAWRIGHGGGVLGYGTDVSPAWADAASKLPSVSPIAEPAKPSWERPHKFEPKNWQGHKMPACEICGRLSDALVHESTPTVIPDAKAETKGVEATEVPYGPTGKRVCYFDVASHPLIPYTSPNPEPQRHARINCNGKSCGEFNCDTCHPQEGELDLSCGANCDHDGTYCETRLREEIANLKAGMAKVREHRDAALRRAEAQQARAMRAEQIVATYNRSGFADADRMAEEYLRAESELANCKEELAALKATPKDQGEVARLRKLLERAQPWLEAGWNAIPDKCSAILREDVAKALSTAQSPPSLPLEEPEQLISDEKLAREVALYDPLHLDIRSTMAVELQAHRRALAARRSVK